MKKHIDLNVHSNHSPWETVITPTEILDFAIKEERPAVAITDLYTVGAFAEFSRAVKREENIKPIYGVRLYCKESGLDKKPFPITLLAQTQAGLRSMYKIISSGYMQVVDEEQWPCTPWNDVLENRSGLLLGQECRWAYIYQSLVGERTKIECLEDIEGRLKEADYVEIRPWSQNRFRKEFGWDVNEEKLKEKAVELIGHLQNVGKLPVAVSNGNCITWEDELCMEILNTGREDLKRPPVNYLKSGEDVLEEYSFFGERLAKDLVLNNPNQIADSIQRVEPMKEGDPSINLPNAAEELKDMCYGMAHRKYGEALPELIEVRLGEELQMISQTDVAGEYVLAATVAKKCNDLAMPHNARGSAGSSLVAFLSGITKTNPLPPHYYCPTCKSVDFVDEKKYPSGFDLLGLQVEKNMCPCCGAQRTGDGHNLPWEMFMGLHGDRNPYFELGVPEEAWVEISKCIGEIFGKENTIVAGDRKHLYWSGRCMVDGHFMGEYVSISEDKKRDLISRAGNVGAGSGRRGNRILVIPKKDDVFDYTPIQYKDQSEIRNGELPFTQIVGYDLDLGGISVQVDSSLSMLKLMEKYSGISPDRIKFENIDIHRFFRDGSWQGLPFKVLWKIIGTNPDFPSRFSDLFKAYGLAHGLGTWEENAQELLRRGIPLEDTIAHRDDIMVTLLHHGVSREKAFAIAEGVRKGKGISGDQRSELKDHELPHWYIKSIEKIGYLFPKAHATEWVITYLQMIWYKVNLPTEFYAAVFSFQSSVFFDYCILLEGKERVLEELRKREEQHGEDRDASQWDEDDWMVSERDTLELAMECFEHGIEFLPPEDNVSHGEMFLPEGTDIRLPLKCRRWVRG